MKNDYKISRALRDTAGSYTCANCLAMITHVDAADVTVLLAGMHDRETRIDVMIAPCFRCRQSARVFRLSGDRRGDSRAISGGAPAGVLARDDVGPVRSAPSGADMVEGDQAAERGVGSS